MRQIASTSKYNNWPICPNMSRSLSLNEEHFHVWIQVSQFKVYFSPCLREYLNTKIIGATSWDHRLHHSILPTHYPQCWRKRIACLWPLKMESAKLHHVVSKRTRCNFNRLPSKAWRLHRFLIWLVRIKSSQSPITIKTPWKPPLSGWQCGSPWSHC